MANRRMFSNKIIMSAKFIKMPASSQALYFHLALNADDDGVVEAFSIMRIVGSAADDLKILIAKGFVIQLNEDEVCFIVDWLEHNQIRADRKIDSIYKPLLLQVVGNIKLIESKPRSDRQQKDSNGTSQGQQMGGIGKDSIGKDSIGKDSIGKDKKQKKPKEIVFDDKHINIDVEPKPDLMDDKTWELFKQWWKQSREVHKLSYSRAAFNAQINNMRLKVTLCHKDQYEIVLFSMNVNKGKPFQNICLQDKYKQAVLEHETLIDNILNFS